MSSWPLVALQDVLRVKHGFAFKGEYFRPEGEQLVLTPGNFKIGGGLQRRDGKERYYSGSYPDEYRLAPGDLLIALTDLTQTAPILGSPLVVPSGGVFLHNQRLGKVEIVDDRVLDRNFAYFMFASDVVRSQLRGSATGSTVRHTAPGRVYSATVALPPLHTQQKIAAILSIYGDLIENDSRRITLLDEMADRIFCEWFVQFRYPGHEDVPLVESELGRVPEGWRVVDLGVLARVEKGLSYKGAYLGEGGLPMANLKCFEVGGGFRRDGTKPYSGPFKEKHAVGPGTLIVANTDLTQAGNVIGSPAIVPRRGFSEGGLISHHLFAIRPHEGQGRGFLYHSLRDERFREYSRARASGTTVLGLRTSDCEQYPVLLPPPQLQEQFSALADSILAQSEVLEDSVEDLHATRDFLLPRLMSGDVDVTDLDIAVTEAAE
jgi:type I restriction enzyme, S subunit